MGVWAPEVEKAVQLVEANFPVKGSTYPGHEPDMAHASDFMCSTDVGEKLHLWAQSNAAGLGLEYVIWQQHIWNTKRAGEGWRGMEDRGSPTQNHFDHVHISWPKSGGGGTGIVGAVTGAVDAVAAPVVQASATLAGFVKLATRLLDPVWWKRILGGALGLLVAFIAITYTKKGLDNG